MTLERQFNCITVEKHEGYAILTLDRPDKRNALNLEMQDEIRHALSHVLHEMKVIVVAANGPAFCAGVDLKESARIREDDPQATTLGKVWFETLEHIRRHPAIFIAAVNGFALGGGLTLVNTCDLAVASDAATFGMPEITFGEFAGLAGATALHRMAPKHVARMVLTGERIDAARAREWAIVNEVVPAEDLLKEAVALASKIAAFDATTLRMSKRALWQLGDLPWSASIERGMWLSALSRGEKPE